MTIRLGELADRIGARFDGDRDVVVQRIMTLELAVPGDVSFFANRRYKRQLEHTAASAVIVAQSDAELCPALALVVENPYLGYMLAATLLSPADTWQPGVHPSAFVDPDAVVHPSAGVGANTVVEAGVSVGAGTYIGPGCVISRDTRVGSDCRFTASVTLCHRVTIGDRVIIHPGVVIGSDGFGIANDDGVWRKVPQLGNVQIGDDVEVGANTSIDRGALEDTIIEEGVKLDNQIQIAHNVRIGAHTAIAGCAAIAGSTRIGSRCMIGGAVSIGGHLEIADEVHLTGGSAVASSIKEPGVYSSGMAVQDNRSWRRTHARLRQLDQMARRLKDIEDKLRG